MGLALSVDFMSATSGEMKETGMKLDEIATGSKDMSQKLVPSSTSAMGPRKATL